MEEEIVTDPSAKITPKCLICEKEFCSTATMLRHMRNVHKERTDDLLSRKSKIVCCICPPGNEKFSCKNLNELQKHMESQHGIKFKLEKYQFKSESEFMDWKSKIERENVARYVKASGAKKYGYCHKSYFYCSRSGFYKSKGANKHSLKAQGSSKINNTCPSYMCAVTSFIGKEPSIDVEYVSTHVGHRTELEYLPLNKSDRELLSSLISQGMDLNSILNTVRDTSGGNLERIHLTTKKDLLNIKAAQKLKRVVSQNAIDSQSVESWVKEMKNMITEEMSAEASDNPEHYVILYYDEHGNIIHSEVNTTLPSEAIMNVDVSASQSTDSELSSTDQKDAIEKLRSQLIKDAQTAIKKFEQAETLGQLVGMQKVFKTVLPSLNALLNNSKPK